MQENYEWTSQDLQTTINKHKLKLCSVIEFTKHFLVYFKFKVTELL